MKSLQSFLAIITLIWISSLFFIAEGQAGSGQSKITKYPVKTSKACRTGRAKLYDECTDQMVLFKRALKRAAKEKKVLLISYGAEWCIWCHVFDKHIGGQSSRFTYSYGSGRQPDVRYRATLWEREKRSVRGSAKALRNFVARSFVVLHVDAMFAPKGLEVLQHTGAINHRTSGIPFIFSVDRKGRFAARHSHDRTAIRRDTNDWYRGYDRRKLLQELKEMHRSAL